MVVVPEQRCARVLFPLILDGARIWHQRIFGVLSPALVAMGNGSSFEQAKTVYLDINGKEEKVRFRGERFMLPPYFYFVFNLLQCDIILLCISLCSMHLTTVLKCILLLCSSYYFVWHQNLWGAEVEHGQEKKVWKTLFYGIQFLSFLSPHTHPPQDLPSP